MHDVWVVLNGRGEWQQAYPDDQDAAVAHAASIAGMIVRLPVARDYRGHGPINSGG